MTVSVIVPVAHDGAERDAAWRWLRPTYPADWEVVQCCDTSKGAWSKGRAVAAGAAQATGDTFVIADCDLLIDQRVLQRAVELVAERAPWVMPHGVVYRLGKKSTVALLKYDTHPLPARTVGRRHNGPVGGGFVVCSRAGYDTVRGIDPRFTGWGGEDISFGRALDTLVGSHLRLWAPTWHLWHVPMVRPQDGRRASPENERLAGRYLDAVGDRTAMRAIVEEHS